MTSQNVLRIVANQDDAKQWTTWVGPKPATTVSSLAEAVERAESNEQGLLVQPEAYDQMVVAGVAKPGAMPGSDWHDFA
jgi:hypothetical protein